MVLNPPRLGGRRFSRHPPRLALLARDKQSNHHHTHLDIVSDARLDLGGDVRPGEEELRVGDGHGDCWMLIVRVRMLMKRCARGKSETKRASTLKAIGTHGRAGLALSLALAALAARARLGCRLAAGLAAGRRGGPRIGLPLGSCQGLPCRLFELSQSLCIKLYSAVLPGVPTQCSDEAIHGIHGFTHSGTKLNLTAYSVQSTLHSAHGGVPPD